jgi:hypothetical protein
LGRSAVALVTAERTSSIEMPSPAIFAVSTSMRTAGCTPPPTPTWPTPGTCAIFCASTVFAASNTCGSGTLLLRSEMIRIGASAWLTL